MRRDVIGRCIATIAGVVAIAGTFLPWIRSGARRRNSYDVFAIVERLGYSPSGAVGWAVRLWPLFPLLVVITVTLGWSRSRRAAASFGAVTAVYGGVVALAVLIASPAGLVARSYGPWVTLIAAADLLAATVFTSAIGRVPPAPRGGSAAGPS